MRVKATRKFGKNGSISKNVTVWPTGYVNSCWPIPMVLNAIDNYGANVIDVEEMIIAKETHRFFEPYIRLIAPIRNKNLKVWKLLYQRAWTKCRPAEWYRGVVIEGQARWQRDTIDWLSNKLPPGRMMRPDVTAYVAAHNASRVVNAVNSLPYDTVASVHIDSIHVDSTVDVESLLDTGNKPGQWRHCKTGRARFYGIGDYTYSGEPGQRTGAAGEMVLKRLRNWHGDTPNKSALSMSDTPHYGTQSKEALPVSESL